MWETPLSAIVMVWRGEWLRHGKVFPLQVVEEIDNGNSEKA